jgi:hypothetical protein
VIDARGGPQDDRLLSCSDKLEGVRVISMASATEEGSIMGSPASLA